MNDEGLGYTIHLAAARSDAFAVTDSAPADAARTRSQTITPQNLYSTIVNVGLQLGRWAVGIHYMPYTTFNCACHRFDSSLLQKTYKHFLDAGTSIIIAKCIQ